MPIPTPKVSQEAVQADYYKHLFGYLFSQHGDAINRALLAEPAALRRRFFRDRFVVGARLGRDEAWPTLFPYLEQIEGALAAVLARHSAAYWWHIYRRISPHLHKDHEGKTDPVTVVLVRKIADLAIAKHSGPWREGDLIPSTRVRVETYLSGLYAKASEKLLGSVSKGKEIFEASTGRAQWVLGRLSPSDFIDMHRVEGLSYEYWRTTAALRTIGKGIEVSLGKSGWFDYHSTDEQDWLIAAYDAHIGSPGGFTTNFGTWYSSERRPDYLDFFIWAQYNVNRRPNSFTVIMPDGGEASLRALPNFEIGRDSLSDFWRTVQFADADFEKRNGYPLRAVLTWIWAISLCSVFPEKSLLQKMDNSEVDHLTSLSIVNLALRGYTLIHLTKERLLATCIAMRDALPLPFDRPSDSELESALDFICLTPAGREQIGIWTGGKAFPVIPDGPVTVLDMAAVSELIEGMFFKVGDKANAKGPSFEEVLRTHIREQGFEVVHAGELRWTNGAKREVDAAVRVGTTLVLLECVSAERPLDFEIARPKTFDERTNRLSRKLDQARSLAEVVKNARTGSNFDFSWAERIDHRVVSPLHEFLWAKGEPCFDASGFPRVVEPGLCIRLLKRVQAGEN